MKHLILIVALILPVVVSLRCSDSGGFAVIPPLPGSNLIENASFESHNRPSLDGWTPNTTDTAFVNFSTLVPPGGGSYSVRLRNEWSFPGTIRYALLPVPGAQKYRLSVWGRAIKTGGLFAGGELSLITTTGGVDTMRKSMHFADTLWTYGQFDEAFSSETVDTIFVQLRGNIDQWSSGYILFDMCSLEIQ